MSSSSPHAPEERHHASLLERLDMEVDARLSHTVEFILPSIGNFQKARMAERQMPDSIVIAIIIVEELTPLLPGQTRVMLGFALPIVGLQQLKQLIDFDIEPFRMLTLLVFQVLQIVFADACFEHGALPARLSPPFKIL